MHLPRFLERVLFGADAPRQADARRLLMARASPRAQAPYWILAADIGRAERAGADCSSELRTLIAAARSGRVQSDFPSRPLLLSCPEGDSPAASDLRCFLATERPSLTECPTYRTFLARHLSEPTEETVLRALLEGDMRLEQLQRRVSSPPVSAPPSWPSPL